MGKLMRFITRKDIRFSALSKYGFLNWMSDEKHIKIMFKNGIGYELDLNDPKTYNEKIQWLKLYDRRDEYTTMVDKYLAKEYVASKIGIEHVIPILGGPYYSFDEIDFNQLPNQFVLKTNHDCGGIVICKDKTDFNFKRAKRLMESHLKKNYYYFCREWPYKNVRPCIFAEQYMSDFDDNLSKQSQLTDYKFICFNGVPKVVCVCTDRVGGNVKFDYYDMDRTHLPFTWVHPKGDYPGKLPIKFDEMQQYAKVLSEGCPCVRIDFYESNEQVYFGEITFFHQGGFAKFTPEEWDRKLGDWIDLNFKYEGDHGE